MSQRGLWEECYISSGLASELVVSKALTTFPVCNEKYIIYVIYRLASPRYLKAEDCGSQESSPYWTCCLSLWWVSSSDLRGALQEGL